LAGTDEVPGVGEVWSVDGGPIGADPEPLGGTCFSGGGVVVVCAHAAVANVATTAVTLRIFNMDYSLVVLQDV
jgi:hypothetical protein